MTAITTELRCRATELNKGDWYVSIPDVQRFLMAHKATCISAGGHFDLIEFLTSFDSALQAIKDGKCRL